MAVRPKADELWWRHSVQWQMYTAMGFGEGVVKVIRPHWQEPSMVACFEGLFMMKEGGRRWCSVDVERLKNESLSLRNANPSGSLKLYL